MADLRLKLGLFSDAASPAFSDLSQRCQEAAITGGSGQRLSGILWKASGSA